VQLERGGSLDWDYLVIATGARLVPSAIPGLEQGAHGFYSLLDAERLRETLRTFRGGKVRIGVAGIPYKCPPAPVEFTFMVEEYLRKRGIRDRSQVTLLSPLNRAFTIESASKLIAPIMKQRGIELSTFFNVETVEPSAGLVNSLEGEQVDYDLLVLVPPHKGAEVVIESGLSDASGWLPTDRHTLNVEGQERIFALGDATNLPISKSGSTAHFEAPVVASRIASMIGGSAPKENYGGRVMCFLETGNGRATALRFDYEHPPTPPQPSRVWHAAKWMFNRLYWETVPTGRLPDRMPGTTPDVRQRQGANR
jgi:sulfide:quinone oxidoreductase